VNEGDMKALPPPYIPPPLPDDEQYIFETLMKGINFDKYDNIPVECTGRGAPTHGLTRYTLTCCWLLAGSRVVRIDPLHFLAGCHTRRLNQV